MAAVLAGLLLLGSAPGVALYEQGVSHIDALDAGARIGAEVAEEAATLRNGPGALYDAVATVWDGQALRYLDTADGWVRVEAPSGRRGWLEGSPVAAPEGAGRSTCSCRAPAWATRRCPTG
jgi:uncharacterized protein YgiM (DUF1202 family)